MADLNIGNSSASVLVNAKHNGSVIPQINNTYDLGTSTLKWKSIYGDLKGNADTATHFENNSFRTLRDFPNGTLITTDLSGGTTNSSIPFYIEIVGNGYGNGLVAAYCQGYVYHLGDGYSQYINCDAYSIGKSFTNTIYAFSNSNGKLCFWFASMAYWQGFDIKVYDTSENINTKKLINHVVSVTNVTLPTTRSWETQIAVRKFIDSGIIDSKYVKKSGDTMTGSLTTPNLFVVNDSSNSGYDALAYFRNYSNNDWAMIIDKNNAYDCGLDIRASGSNALRVNGSSRFKNSATFGADVAPSYTVDVRGKTRSTDRIYANEWVQFDNYTGLYSPNNNAHFYPNNSTTYGQWKILGSKGGYSGIQLGDTTDYMTLMDDGVNKGLYQENQGKWLFYYNASNQGVGIRTSSLSDYAVTCDGDFYCSNGWLRTTGARGWYNESYGGGWYMTDSTYIRNYAGKATRLDNLCLGSDNNSYRLYVNGTSYFANNMFIPADKSLIQYQNDSSNYTALIKWYKGSKSQNTYDPQIGQHNTGGTNSAGSITILPYATATSPWEGSVGLYITKNVLKLDGNRIPTAGSNGSVGSATVPVYSDGGVLKTITSYSGNAATATKLATARTISLTGSVTGSGTFDGSGNLSIATTTNHTHAAATTSANGFMSSSDKSKLDGIATGANKYSHPTYTSRASGLYKITVDGTGHVSAATAVAKSDITALGIPSTNTTYSAMTGASTTTAGTTGLVPAPAKGAANRYLRSDGTWQVPPDTNTTYSVATTSSNGLMSSSDKTKLNNANINVYKMSNIDTVATGSSKYVDIGFCSGYNTSFGGTYICISISWQGYAIQFRMGQGASTVKTRCTNTSKQWTAWH